MIRLPPYGRARHIGSLASSESMRCPASAVAHRRKESEKLGPGPSGMGDAYRLARMFEGAFREAVASKDTSPHILDALEEKGLKGRLDAINLDAIFTLENLRRTCKTAEGYQGCLSILLAAA